jgi:hypothetical protein
MRALLRAKAVAGTLGAALLLLAGSARAVTLVSGGTLGDETWTAAGSPYLVNDDLLVPPGKALILEAGTSVVVGSSDLSATGQDPERIELRIQGELYVNGTLSAPVNIWNENTSVRDAWYGIVLEPEATHARLQYARIANGYDCLESSAPAANLEVVATTTSNPRRPPRTSRSSPRPSTPATRAPCSRAAPRSSIACSCTTPPMVSGSNTRPGRA